MDIASHQDLVWARLSRRDVREIAHASPTEITCLEGSLWITVDHDRRDVVLTAGESFIAPARQRTLAYALEDARMALRQSRVAVSRRAADAHLPAGGVLAT